MNVTIISTSSFPWGMAATTRVRCLAKGMMREGIHIQYIGLCGADVDYSIDRKKNGRVDGIAFSYPGGFAVRPGSWLLRRIDDFFGTWGTVAKLIQMKRHNKLDVVIIYSRNHKTVLFWSRVSHFMKTPVVLELCEWPLAIAQTHQESLNKAHRFCHDAVLSVDGVIPISSYIEEETRKITANANKSISSFKIPILIDLENESAQASSNASDVSPYLLYAGSISYFDIAKLVIDISANLSSEGILIPIKFTGGGAQNKFDALKEYANSKGVLENFEFTGYVSDPELTKLMENATALLAPLPENLQSISRFPTKIGYYLASGRPVITNSIGDIDLHLKDGINAFVASGCSAEKIADKIRLVLANLDSAEKVGLAGRKYAFQNFHYSQATKGIRSYLKSFQSSYR